MFILFFNCGWKYSKNKIYSPTLNFHTIFYLQMNLREKYFVAIMVDSDSWQKESKC